MPRLLAKGRRASLWLDWSSGTLGDGTERPLPPCLRDKHMDEIQHPGLGNLPALALLGPKLPNQTI